jgi:RNA polymerase sigma-70 factor (ECF subfamily)
MQRDLIERAARGDTEAFTDLVATRVGRLDGAARLIVRDPERAKDAVQEALVRAWRDLPSLRDPDRFDAWLHRLLVRACLDEGRRFGRHRFEVELSPIHVTSVPDASGAVSDRDQLDRAFRRLPADQRTALVLVHYLDLSLAEAAMALGVPIGTARSRLYRGLTALRSALDAAERSTPELAKGRLA